MKEGIQYVLPGFSADGKDSVTVPLSGQEIVAGPAVKVVISNRWTGAWPGKITYQKATPEELARLQKINEESLVKAQTDLDILSDAYPDADEETLNKRAVI